MRLNIMEVKYKGYTIKVREGNICRVHYHVWTSKGKYWGFKYTIVDARKWIDAEEACLGK